MVQVQFVRINNSYSPGLAKCGNCQNIIPLVSSRRSLIKCSTCSKVTSLGVNYARSRAVIYLFLTCIFLLFSAGITFTTYELALEHGGGYFLLIIYSLSYLAVLFSLTKSIYYFTRKVSMQIIETDNVSEI